MYDRDRRLQFPFICANPDPAFARTLQQAIGGVRGKIRVCIRYFFQPWGNRAPKPKYRDMLLHSATGELGHIGMLAAAVTLNLDRAPTHLQEEGVEDSIVGAVMGGENPRHSIEGLIHRNLLSGGIANVPIPNYFPQETEDQATTIISTPPRSIAHSPRDAGPIASRSTGAARSPRSRTSRWAKSRSWDRPAPAVRRPPSPPRCVRAVRRGSTSRS